MLHTEDFQYQPSFELELGGSLPGFQLRFTTFGSMNRDKTNVVWVCHALTGNANVLDWWPGLFGKGMLYDPEQYFIICANMLGSCYGSTGPLSVNPLTRQPFYHDFPVLTNRDMLRSFDLLRQHLGIARIDTLIGGSMGGQHALEWSIMHPDCVTNLIQIASNAQHSPWGIAFNETQRMAIEQDATWQHNHPDAGLNGMKTARAIALLSYRHYRTYEKTQSEDADAPTDHYRASSYQQYQGEKLARRFNAFSYWTLSKAMDSHHVGRDRGGIVRAIQAVKARCLFVGMKTDLLFPLIEQEFLAHHVPKATLSVLDSDYGHDGFLIETAKLTEAITAFYDKTPQAALEK